MKQMAQIVLVAVLCGSACGDPGDKADEIVVIVNSDTSSNVGGSTNQTTGSSNNTTSTVPNHTTIAMSLSIEEYLPRARELYCEALFNCPNTNTIYGLLAMSRYGSVEGCVEAQNSNLDLELSAVNAGIEAGRIRYDGERATECLEAITKWWCDEESGRRVEGIPECVDVLSGALELGQQCASAHECAEGWCDTQAPCSERTCVQIQESCGDDFCVTSSEFCDRSSDTCRARRPAGSACSFGQCERGTACTFVTDGTCASWGSQSASAPCVIDQVCAPGLVCDDSACRPTTFGGAGAACSSSRAANCEPGLVCRIPAGSQTGTCGQPLGRGASCWADWSCEPGLMCDSWNGRTCEPFLDDGETCQSFAQCASNRCPGGMGSSADGVCEPACSP